MGYLTPRDVAEDLGLSLDTVLLRIRTGAIPAFKPAEGRVWRIDPEDYAAAKAEWKRATTPTRTDPGDGDVDPVTRIAPRSPRAQAALDRKGSR